VANKVNIQKNKVNKQVFDRITDVVHTTGTTILLSVESSRKKSTKETKPELLFGTTELT
jgi:hypothetical protein